MPRPRRRPRPGDWPNGDHRLRRALPALAELGVEVPAAVLDAYGQARGLRGEGRSADARAAAARHEIAEGLASGRLDPSDAPATVAAAPRPTDPATRAVFRRAAGHAYCEAVAAFDAAAPELLDRLREILSDTVAAQAKQRHLDPDCAERYKQVHGVAALLRDGLDGLEPGSPWWRFDHPELVWSWRCERADDPALRAARPLGLRVEVAEAGTEVLGDGRHVRYFEAVGVPSPTLDVIAAHADEWEPTICTAEQVIQNAARVDEAQRG